MMPDLPEPMAETTEDCSPSDDIPTVFSDLHADLRSLAPCSPAVPTDLEVIFFSPPIFVTHLSNQVSNDKIVNPDSTFTFEASNKDPAVETSSTAPVQFLSDDTNEDQKRTPPTYSFPTDCGRLLWRPNQFQHHAETASSVHSRQQCNDSSPFKPTAIIRPQISSRLRYGVRPEFNS